MALHLKVMPTALARPFRAGSSSLQRRLLLESESLLCQTGTSKRRHFAASLAMHMSDLCALSRTDPPLLVCASHRVVTDGVVVMMGGNHPCKVALQAMHRSLVEPQSMLALLGRASSIVVRLFGGAELD